MVIARAGVSGKTLLPARSWSSEAHAVGAEVLEELLPRERVIGGVP